MKRSAAFLFLILLSGCVAVTVERRRPRRGPVKEVGYIDLGGGEVRYSAVGWRPFVSSRRKLAFKLMRVNCGKDLEPKVTDEFERQDADAAYNGVDIDSSMSMGDQHYVIERYVHLVYECVSPGASPTLAVSTTSVHAPALIIPEVVVSSAASVAPSTATVPSPSSSTLVSPEPPR